MTIEFNLPTESIAPSAESKESYRRFAQKKIIFFDKSEDYEQFVSGWYTERFKFFGHTTMGERGLFSPGQVLIDGIHGSKDPYIEDFTIVINKPSFIINDEDFTDIITLVIEHEIGELWYKLKRGFRPTSAHRMALIEETKLAVKLGNERKSIKFTNLLYKNQPNEDVELMKRVVARERALAIKRVKI